MMISSQKSQHENEVKNKSFITGTPEKQFLRLKASINVKVVLTVCTLERMGWEGHFVSGVFLFKVHNPLMRKKQTNPN